MNNCLLPASHPVNTFRRGRMLPPAGTRSGRNLPALKLGPAMVAPRDIIVVRMDRAEQRKRQLEEELDVLQLWRGVRPPAQRPHSCPTAVLSDRGRSAYK